MRLKIENGKWKIGMNKKHLFIILYSLFIARAEGAKLCFLSNQTHEGNCETGTWKIGGGCENSGDTFCHGTDALTGCPGGVVMSGIAKCVNLSSLYSSQTIYQGVNMAVENASVSDTDGTCFCKMTYPYAGSWVFAAQGSQGQFCSACTTICSREISMKLYLRQQVAAGV